MVDVVVVVVVVSVLFLPDVVVCVCVYVCLRLFFCRAYVDVRIDVRRRKET